MTTILLAGVGPLATDPRAASGPNFRTTLFWDALAGPSHTLHLASLGGEEADGTSETLIDGGGRMVQFSPQAMLDGRALREWAAALRPQAIIGCGTVLPAAAAARLNDIAPVWIDLAGDPVAEVQSKAQAYPDEPYETLLHHVWKLAQTAVRRADRLSGVSHAQCHALMGMLSMLGRLNRETAAAPMVFRLPNGPLPQFHKPAAERAPVLRAVRVPQDAFLAAWSGSYNTWIDPDLLYDGLVNAMDRLEHLHFVSTGGGAAGYNEGLYEQFQRRVRQGRHAERFHLLGWIGRDEAEAIHRECDLGLNIDRWCYEGVLGARNRIVNFLDLGVPVATTVLAEISRELVACGGALEIPLGDARGMAQVLVDAEADRARLKDSLARGLEYLRANNFFACADPLRQWADSPARAGDFRTSGYASAVAERTDFEAIEAMLAELHERRQGCRLRRFVQRLRGSGR